MKPVSLPVAVEEEAAALAVLQRPAVPAAGEAEAVVVAAAAEAADPADRRQPPALEPVYPQRQIAPTR